MCRFVTKVVAAPGCNKWGGRWRAKESLGGGGKIVLEVPVALSF